MTEFKNENLFKICTPNHMYITFKSEKAFIKALEMDSLMISEAHSEGKV